jgi:hypothetical protein
MVVDALHTPLQQQQQRSRLQLLLCTLTMCCMQAGDYPCSYSSRGCHGYY